MTLDRCTTGGATLHLMASDAAAPSSRPEASRVLTAANKDALLAHHNKLEAERLMGIGCSSRAGMERGALPFRQ